MAAAEGAATPAFDSATLWSALAQPWRELQRWPPLRWLTPLPPVHVLHADGSQAIWVGDARRALPPGGGGSAPFVALEIPPDDCLELGIRLPAMAPADRDAALALEVRTASPFEPSNLVWGARAPQGSDGAGVVTAILASRSAVLARLEAASALVGGRAPAEVWAFDAQARPVVIQGFGEARRLRRAQRDRRIGWALLVLALLLGVAAAVTPTVQLKLRAMQAAAALEQVEREVAPVLAQREALVKAQGQRDALRELMSERVEPLAVLDLVTQAMPDDAWVQRLQMQGSKLTLVGHAPNAAALMNRLSSQPQVRDVKSPSAATRAAGGREHFTIELALTPEALRPEPDPRRPAPAAAPVAPVAPATPATPPAPAAPVAAMPSVSAPASALAPTESVPAAAAPPTPAALPASPAAVAPARDAAAPARLFR